MSIEPLVPVDPISGWHEWTLADQCDDGWSHTSVAVLDDGSIVTYHPRDPALLVFDGDGTLLRAVPTEAYEGHDFAVAPEGIWIADCAHKLCLSPSRRAYVHPPVADAVGQVLLVGDDGTTLRRIGSWHDGPFLPTGVAVDPAGRGVWIADGYGANRVDLVGPDDAVLVTIDGLDQPHGILVVGDDLYVTERKRSRLAVYDLDGTFRRHEGEGHLRAPSALARIDDGLYVADLFGRVTVLDGDGAFVGHHGELAERQAGWPNAGDEDHQLPPVLTPGVFNSPHGIAAVDGDLVVTEWVLGGRWVRYSPGARRVR